MKSRSRKKHHHHQNRLSELRKRLPPGTSPGMLQSLPDAQPTRITLVAYSKAEYVEVNLNDISKLPYYLSRYPVSWIQVAGFKDLALIEALGKALNLHSLSLEDALYGHHRTKIEAYEHYLFIIAQRVSQAEKFHTEQVSIVLMEKCVITFREKAEDCFAPVRVRMKNPAGRIRNRGADYLAYTLLDAIIDNYYPMLSCFNEALERLEMQVVEGFHKQQVVEIYTVKTNIVALHRAIWPMREVISLLMREEDAVFVTDETIRYLRDCYDHVIQLEELTEYCRDISSGLMDLHLSFSGQRMNETMKLLTLVSTIFIPLSFIASLYGMNFHDSPFNMPELGWKYGYFYVLALMLCVACIMLYLFKRRGWLDSSMKAEIPAENNT